VLALAAQIFGGQALARQSRSEWTDASTLAVIGMDRRSMVLSAVMRAAVVAAVAVVAAAVVVVGTSWLGPVGVGRSAEPHPGLDVDPTVLAVGLPIVAVLVVACVVGPVATTRRRPHASVATRPRATTGVPPAGLAGVAMSRSRRSGRLALGAAIAGVAVAATVGVAALTLLGSYDRLLAEPARYGSTWDAQVGNVGSVDQEIQTRERLATIPGIGSVAGLRSLDGIGGDPGFSLVATETLVGDPDVATILAGRFPSEPTEIAMGRVSLRERGLVLGDEFVATHPSDPSIQAALTIVGEAVVNAGYTNRPGVGGLVTNDFADLVAPDSLSQVYVVWVDPEADRDVTLAALRDAFPTTFLEQSTPTQVSNLGLVSDQPTVVALAVALLAGAALTHALVMSVRRSRRDIGVWRSIGFTRAQVVAAVGWHATLLSVIGLAVGIPLGMVVGRLAWRLIVDDLGVASPPVAPLAGLGVVVAVVLLVANVAALFPGVAAARMRPAAALRTE
jgi:hypothetical protein